MFAFAIYDTHARKLWLVRDRLGIKPLLLPLAPRRLGLRLRDQGHPRAGPASPPACDIASLHEWLYYGNALGGRTLFEGIRQLLPGHYLELDLDDVRSRASSVLVARPSTRKTAPCDARPASAMSGNAPPARTGRSAATGERRAGRRVPVGRRRFERDHRVCVASLSRAGSRRIRWASTSRPAADELPKATKRGGSAIGTDHHEFHIAAATSASWSKRWCSITTCRSPTRRTFRST